MGDKKEKIKCNLSEVNCENMPCLTLVLEGKVLSLLESNLGVKIKPKDFVYKKDWQEMNQQPDLIKIEGE